MKRKEKEKALTKVQAVDRIRKFFKGLFFKPSQVQENQNTVNEKENNQFRETIQIKQDEEELRILELQQEFKKGDIEEEEIPEDDYEKLIKLYDDQNEKLQQEIERYKKETYKILQEIKKG